MNVSPSDDLLWQLTSLDEESGVEPPSRDLLAAYRDGTLDEEQTRSLERHLAASPAARDALRRDTSLPLEAAPEEVRRRLLESLSAGGGSRARGRRSLLFPLVAGLLLAAGLWLVLGQGVPWRPEPPQETARAFPDFEVRLEATGSVRSTPRDQSDSEEGFLPHSTIDLVVEPWQSAEGLEFGLYRLHGQDLERLDGKAGIEREVYRGAARFRARVSDLVGTAPGEHTLLVVVARSGDLPAESPAELGEDPVAQLSEDGRRRIISRTLSLRPAAEPGGESGSM